MADKLPPYDESAKCQACGHGDVNTTYHSEDLCPRDTYPCLGPSEPHLARTCRRCGHMWSEATVAPE